MTATDTQDYADRQYMHGAAHGWRNYRMGIGFPLGHKDERGVRTAPAGTFMDMDYGRGYCAGWLEASAFAGGKRRTA